MGRRSRELYSQDSHRMVRDPQTAAVTVVADLPKVGGGCCPSLPQKTRKISNKQSHVTSRETRG